MDGQLEKQLVARDFWPACSTCRHVEACKTRPQHPAYPHTWHWGKEAVSFPDGELILRSWVGTAAMASRTRAVPAMPSLPATSRSSLPTISTTSRWRENEHGLIPRSHGWNGRSAGPFTM